MGAGLEREDITDGFEEAEGTNSGAEKAEVTNAGAGEERNLAGKPEVSGDKLSSRLLLSSSLSSLSSSSVVWAER